MAYAWWTVSGTATAQGTATEAQLDVQATSADDLYPGGYRPVTITVTNSNVYPVNFGQVLIDNVTVDEAHVGCDPNAVEIDPATRDHSAVLLPGQVQDFEIGVGLATWAPQECAGATFSITYLGEGFIG